MQNLEAVTVCYHYGDFLRKSARHNRGLFDRWVVVTGSDDLETRHVCRDMGLVCVTCDEALRDGQFAKGAMIERGLHMLSANSWRLHIDADIVMPPFGRRQLADLPDLDPDCVYGADRVMVRSWKDWQKLQASEWMSRQRRGNYVTFPDGYAIGTRWASPTKGYVPIGFFQLWHAGADEWSGSRVKPYPQAHGNACRTDVQHGLQWDRRQRMLIPELLVVHLESEQGPKGYGANWNGRTTKRFGVAEKTDGPVGGS